MTSTKKPRDRTKATPPSLPAPPRAAGPAARQGRITVIRDTREREGHGWTWAASTTCAGTLVKKLDTGDYSILGYENDITVDRKGNVAEFAGNLTQARFTRELERMRSFKVAVVLLEFDFEDMARWPEGSGIPAARRRYMKFNKHALLARYWQVRLAYPHVDFMFAGLHGKEAVSSLFKRFLERYGRQEAGGEAP